MDKASKILKEYERFSRDVGKHSDEVVECFLHEHGEKYKDLSYADFIKTFRSMGYLIPPEWVNGSELRKKPVEKLKDFLIRAEEERTLKSVREEYKRLIKSRLNQRNEEELERLLITLMDEGVDDELLEAAEELKNEGWIERVPTTLNDGSAESSCWAYQQKSWSERHPRLSSWLKKLAAISLPAIYLGAMAGCVNLPKQPIDKPPSIHMVRVKQDKPIIGVIKKYRHLLFNESVTLSFYANASDDVGVKSVWVEMPIANLTMSHLKNGLYGCNLTLKELNPSRAYLPFVVKAFDGRNVASITGKYWLVFNEVVIEGVPAGPPHLNCGVSSAVKILRYWGINMTAEEFIKKFNITFQYGDVLLEDIFSPHPPKELNMILVRNYHQDELPFFNPYNLTHIISLGFPASIVTWNCNLTNETFSHAFTCSGFKRVNGSLYLYLSNWVISENGNSITKYWDGPAPFLRRSTPCVPIVYGLPHRDEKTGQFLGFTLYSRTNMFSYDTYIPKKYKYLFESR